MRKFYFTILPILLLFCVNKDAIAQRGMIRNKVRNDIERKQAEKHKEKGVKAIEDITYENDTRYKDFKGKSKATLEFKNTDYDKKGKPKEPRIEKMVFGKLGECMVMNAGDKNETWLLANYIDKAHYMVNVKDKSAMKMPMMNFKKMAEKMAQKQAAAQNSDNKEMGKWQATNETQKINGFNCKKYIYTYPEGSSYSTFETWVTKDVNIVIDNNYIFGSNIGKLNSNAAKDANIPLGMIVLSKLYNSKNLLVSERELVKASNTTEEQYFDLTPFKINDVLDALR